MRYFYQLLSIGMVFLVSHYLFPDTVLIYNDQTLVVATVVYSIACMFFAFLIIGSLFIFLLQGQLFTVIILGCGLSIITSYCSLVATETMVPGFQIIGFYPRLIIAFLTALSTTIINTSSRY